VLLSTWKSLPELQDGSRYPGKRRDIAMHLAALQKKTGESEATPLCGYPTGTPDCRFLTALTNSFSDVV